MKKLLLSMAMIGLASGVSSVAVAEDVQHNVTHEERTMHYEGQSYATTDEALEALKAHNKEIAELIKAEMLSNSDLERIHEISYSLETAIDKMIAEKAGKADQLGAIDEAVQAVHYASENHEDAQVREWFAKLEAAVATLDGKIVQSKTNADGAYELVIKDHMFTPDELHVPAGQKIKLVVHNQDPTPEEFESDDFRREKIVPGNSSATIYVGPLKPGKYHFFGEFNLDKANGYLYAE